MKKKIVMWVTIPAGETETKHLAALQLNADENAYDLWTFPADSVSDEFHEKLMSKWRDGNSSDFEFPQPHEHQVFKLAAANDLLPEGWKPEREDVVKRTKAEWMFAVLSTSAYQTYRQEIADFAEKVEKLTEYDRKMWDELKAFWDRVQEQARDRNIFRDHADNLKKEVNVLFDKLKEMRASVDAKLEEEMKASYEKVNAVLVAIEQRLDKGIFDFKRVFSELRKVQSEYFSLKLSREQRDDLWKRIDHGFKKAKQARFGEDDPFAVINKRILGLEDAIKRLEVSIKMDKGEMEHMQRRIDTGKAGQLETQLREAKFRLIEENLSGKTVRLEEMRKTYDELMVKAEQIKVSQEKAKVVAEKKAVLEAQKKEESRQKTEDAREQMEKAVNIMKEEGTLPSAEKGGKKKAAKATEETTATPAEETPATEAEVHAPAAEHHEEAPVVTEEHHEAPAAEHHEEAPVVTEEHHEAPAAEHHEETPAAELPTEEHGE